MARPNTATERSMREELRASIEAERREAKRNAALTARSYARIVAAQSLRLQKMVTGTAVRSDDHAVAAEGLRDELAELVRTHARLMRQLGQPADDVVVLMKEILDAAGRDVSADGHVLDGSCVSHLRDEIVRWSVSGYYDVDG